MPVPQQTPIIAHTGNGVTTAFAFPFLLDRATDLVVAIDGAQKALSTDYTVAGTGNIAGGTVTFTSAPANGVRVVFTRRTALQRLTDYQTGGANRANVLDADLDRLWLALQDGWLGVQKAVRYQNGDSGPTRMPVLADGQVLGQLGGALVGRDLASADSMNFLQSGTGAVTRSMQDKAREWVSVRDFGAVLDGVADDTAVIQTTLNQHPGKRILIDGPAKVTSVLTVSGDNTEIEFTGTGGLTYTSATSTCVIVAGASCKITGGSITAPAVFDPTNDTSLLTYAVVNVTGSDCRISGLTLVNVPKVGIRFTDTNRGSVTNCKIDGNIPSSMFTGTQTLHVGVLIDPPPSSAPGQFIVQGNFISTCVQGIFAGNYGAASYEQGISVYGNVFRNCWNHGVYFGGLGNGNSVIGNNFIRCQLPIAVTGNNHVVSGNAIQTQSTGTYTDIVGISMRDPNGCVVSNNVIKGDALPLGVVVSLAAVSFSDVSNNVVSGNVITVAGGSSNAIKIGGSSAATVNNNVVTGNVCIGVGRADEGLIHVQCASALNAYGNVVSDNTVVQKGPCYGIYAINMTGVLINGNNIRLEYDAPSATTLYGVLYVGCVNGLIAKNNVGCSSAWGANVTYKATAEAGSGSKNRSVGNNPALDYTKLTPAPPFDGVAGSGLVIDESGPGVPSLNAGVGSRWWRTDGGANTVLYVKEVGTGSGGWVAK